MTAPYLLTPALGKGVGVPRLAAAFKAQLDSAASDQVLAVLGDSTGNGTDEWVYLLTQVLEAGATTHYIDHYLYDDATKAYVLTALLGRQSTFSNMTDAFTRPDGALGTTSSGGQVWKANTWTIASNIAYPSSTSAYLEINAPLAASSFKIQADLKYSTTGDYRIYALDGSSKYLFFALNGAGSVSVFLQDGVSPGVVATMAALGLSAGQFYTMTIVKDSLNIWVHINGRQMVVALTSAQDARLTGRSVGFNSVSSITGHAWDNIKVGGITKPSNKLTIRNGSVSGTGFTYHATNIATLVPERPDFAFVSLGHNETAKAPAAFMAAYDTYVAALRTQAGGAPIPIAAVVQNPQMSPAANVAAHAANMLALKAGCPSRGLDRIDVYDAFNASPLGLSALIDNSDGVHPIPAGSALWEATTAARMGLTT